MRLWSIHPRYLDTRGLLALWREGLLAQKALLGLTKGYRCHPQLDRFRAACDPGAAMGAYLAEVAREADRRGYRFDRSKIATGGPCSRISVRRGQVEYEWRHLLGKLEERAPQVYEKITTIRNPEVHPLFRVVPGGIEKWERI